MDDTTYLSPEKVERGIGLEHLLEGATTLSITTLRIASLCKNVMMTSVVMVSVVALFSKS